MKVLGKKFIIFALALSISLLLGASFSIAQEKMSMDEYKAQLADWQNREAEAKTAGDNCSSDVEKLKGEIEAAQAEKEQVWNEILAQLETDQAGVDNFRAGLKDLEAQVDGLLALTPEELFKKRDELTAAEEKLNELKQNKIAALTEMQNIIAAIEGKITQAKNKMPKAIYDEYNVVVGDYLWKISGKETVYNDPIQWMRIYSYNKEQIKDPDLIYPDQVLKIQKEVGPDEYLVAKGDYLQKIAGNADVLGDPASWTKIYEKNKDIIGENANLIFPHTVLVIPKE
ncbi:LysM peptidoglycan-binding domain-containing protein [candidate division KSB1 bacterium]|nr:LysM peptidoglycan-binding domain-containing protein [candidate division KSB1 bacterium]